jgi:hypothetical protein
MKISTFSPGFRVRRGTPPLLQSRPLTSGMKNSSSGSSFEFMSFALRGAPCGHPRPWAAFGRYHDQQLPRIRVSDHQEAMIDRVVEWVWPNDPQGVEIDGRAVLERHAVLCQVHAILLHVPVVPRHRGTLAIDACLRATSRFTRAYSGSLAVKLRVRCRATQRRWRGQLIRRSPGNWRSPNCATQGKQVMARRRTARVGWVR